MKPKPYGIILLITGLYLMKLSKCSIWRTVLMLFILKSRCLTLLWQHFSVKPTRYRRNFNQPIMPLLLDFKYALVSGWLSFQCKFVVTLLEPISLHHFIILQRSSSSESAPHHIQTVSHFLHSTTFKFHHILFEPKLPLALVFKFVITAFLNSFSLTSVMLPSSARIISTQFNSYCFLLTLVDLNRGSVIIAAYWKHYWPLGELVLGQNKSDCFQIIISKIVTTFPFWTWFVYVWFGYGYGTTSELFPRFLDYAALLDSSW